MDEVKLEPAIWEVTCHIKISKHSYSKYRKLIRAINIENVKECVAKDIFENYMSTNGTLKIKNFKVTRILNINTLE